MKTETINDGKVIHLTSETDMYITQSATDTPVQFRVFAKELYMNSAVNPNMFRDATEAEYQQWKIDYQKYVDSLYDDGGLLSIPNTETEI